MTSKGQWATALGMLAVFFLFLTSLGLIQLTLVGEPWTVLDKVFFAVVVGLTVVFGAGSFVLWRLGKKEGIE